MSKPIGLVLAGGAGRRLGRPKGALRRRGVTLATRAANELALLCAGVLISVPPGAANPAPGFATLEDEPPAGRGPLAGIDAAFRATDGADLLVLACDYPRVGSALLGSIVAAPTEAALTLVTDDERRDHPLVALWRRRLALPVREALGGGAFRVLDLVAQVTVHRIGPEQLPGVDLTRELLNLNRPEDLDALGGLD